MEHFVAIERAISCPQASVAVAADTAAQVLTSAGYRRGLGFGPTQSYVRAYRPTWAVALAVLLALPTFGLALLLLMVRSKDHCNVVIEDGPYGVVALVSGRVPASLPAALEAASGSYPDQGEAYQQPQQPPPMLLTPSGGYHGGATPPAQPAILRPATPVPGIPDGAYPPPGYPPAPADPYGPPAPHGQPGPYAEPSPYGDPGTWAAPGPWAQPGHAVPGQPAPGPYAQPAASGPAAPAGQPGQPGQPAQQPGQPAQSAPVAHRPPSRLAPPPPADDPVRPGAAPAAAPSAAGAGARGGERAAGEEPFSSTSGRVPWPVAGSGTRAPAMPAPAGPPPVSPAAWSPPVPPAPPAAAGPVPAPVPAAAVAAAPVPAGTAAAAGPAGRQAQPGGVATAVGETRYVLRVDNGEVLDLGPFCLLGREPVAADGDPPATLVRFDDAKLSVSKTHLAYGVDDRGLWVMDRNSTNGTTIIDPSGARATCSPGVRQYLQTGSQVQIGQRRFTVEVPDPAGG